MHQTTKYYFPLKNLIGTWLLLLILFTDSFAADTEKQPRPIVVTIKPLYSLVAHLTEGIDTPVLLMKQVQSPHHYSMKPSERTLLEKAKMIIWTGPPMETFLKKIIQQQKNTAVVVSAMQAKDLILLGKRKKHPANEDRSPAVNKAEAHTIDPHIWLSVHNAIAISYHIAEALISNDPHNAGLYEKNLQQLVNKISRTKALIEAELRNRASPFIVFHDAFQYFENEYQLNYIDSISFDEETGVSLKHIRQIKADIKNNNIHCLLYQDPKPAIVATLAKQTSIKTIALDPLGLNISDDKNAWFEIMQQLSADLNTCLAP